MDVVVSIGRGSKTYHAEDCPYVKRITKKHRMILTEGSAIYKGYCGCKLCTGVRGTTRKWRLLGYDCSYDQVDDAVCIRTDFGFWKAIWRPEPGEWHLFHMNNHGYKCFNAELSTKKLARGSFHRQEDFHPTAKFNKIIQYVTDHDKNRKIILDDYRKMPKNTPKQRKYFRQAKERKKRNAIRRVEEIFKSLESDKKGGQE